MAGAGNLNPADPQNVLGSVSKNNGKTDDRYQSFRAQADFEWRFLDRTLDVGVLCPEIKAPYTSLEFDVNGIMNSKLPAEGLDRATLGGVRGFGVRYADPLVVHMRLPVDGVMNLSSPEQGVYFDILGQTNGHNAIQISWFSNNDYGFLVSRMRAEPVGEWIRFSEIPRKGLTANSRTMDTVHSPNMIQITMA